MDAIGIHGIITLHEIPNEWSEEDFNYWWCPLTTPDGQILQPARITDEAKAQRIVKKTENLITNAGIALILTNLSVANQVQQFPVTQILSVGNGAISGVTRADTSVAGDAFGTNARKAPSSFSRVGFQTTIVTSYASGDANGSWTNIGFYGYNTGSSQNATTTAGTGALMTHALFSFTKGATAYAVNYTFNLSN